MSTQPQRQKSLHLHGGLIVLSCEVPSHEQPFPHLVTVGSFAPWTSSPTEFAAFLLLAPLFTESQKAAAGRQRVRADTPIRSNADEYQKPLARGAIGLVYPKS